jgi:hypothetical protein
MSKIQYVDIQDLAINVPGHSKQHAKHASSPTAQTRSCAPNTSRSKTDKAVTNTRQPAWMGTCGFSGWIIPTTDKKLLIHNDSTADGHAHDPASQLDVGLADQRAAWNQQKAVGRKPRIPSVDGLFRSAGCLDTEGNTGKPFNPMEDAQRVRVPFGGYRLPMYVASRIMQSSSYSNTTPDQVVRELVHHPVSTLISVPTMNVAAELKATLPMTSREKAIWPPSYQATIQQQRESSSLLPVSTTSARLPNALIIPQVSQGMTGIQPSSDPPYPHCAVVNSKHHQHLDRSEPMGPSPARPGPQEQLSGLYDVRNAAWCYPHPPGYQHQRSSWRVTPPTQ